MIETKREREEEIREERQRRVERVSDRSKWEREGKKAIKKEREICKESEKVCYRERNRAR